MAYLDNRVYDNGLSVLDTEANSLVITNAEATTFAQANTTFKLGEAVGGNYPGIGAPAAGSPNGRQVTVAATTNGQVTATGTASHWALIDTVNTRILAAGPLAATQGVTNGNVFTLPSFTVRIPAPA